MKAFYAIVFGRVQGVSFRAFVCAWAIELKLKGFVKNLPDNSVEVVAVGNLNSLKEFEKVLRNGSPSSKVENCKIEWLEPIKHFKNFSIEY